MGGCRAVRRHISTTSYLLRTGPLAGAGRRDNISLRLWATCHFLVPRGAPFWRAEGQHHSVELGRTSGGQRWAGGGTCGHRGQASLPGDAGDSTFPSKHAPHYTAAARAQGGYRMNMGAGASRQRHETRYHARRRATSPTTAARTQHRQEKAWAENIPLGRAGLRQAFSRH